MTNMTPKEIALKAAEAMLDKRAEDVRAFEISHLTVLADVMVLASGRSMVQVKALADEVEEKLEEMGQTALRREGYTDGRWVVLDYGCVLVHIFHEQEREFYRLERLWADGTNEIAIENPEN